MLVGLSALEQLESNAPFSAPFEITNTGYLGVYIDHVVVVVPEAEYGHNSTVTDMGMFGDDFNDFYLERGGTKTIFPRMIDRTVAKADLLIGIDYRYFGVTGRRLFMFEGIQRAKWAWTKQPIGTREAEFNRMVDSRLETLKKTYTTQPTTN